jgi:hypothetical protein
MPLWALQLISTEKGASAPVFGLPEDCLYITAFQPAVWTYDWGIMVRIPRFYAWQSLRARATLDFAPMMKAMQKNQPRLARSLTNMYAYAVRIRNELMKAGWRDRRAMDRAEALSRLNHRKMWERVGYSGRGGEGHRQVRRSRTAQAKHKKAKGTRAR